MPVIPEIPKTKDEDRYGSLVRPDIKIHRKYFDEMVKLYGIQCWYYEPKSNKKYNLHAEIVSDYADPIKVGCIFSEHPDQRTMKKMGWASELQGSASVISVPYDLPGIQVGALFAVPSGIDDADYRMFRVTSMSNIMVYPASITCELVPEYLDDIPDGKKDVSHHNYNLLISDDDEVF